MQTFKMLNGDIALSGGGFTMIDGSDKLIQDLRMALVEPYGSDPFHPGWGSVLGQFIGHPFTDEIAALVKAEVNRVVGNKQRIQLDQMQRAATAGRSNPFSANEVIASLANTEAWGNLDVLTVLATLVVASNSTVQVSAGVTS